MNTDQVAALAQEVLKPRLGPFGFDRVEVEAEQDHDGDNALFITARYRPGGEIPTGELLLEALGSLHKKLRDAGEPRFPYLDHRFAGDDATFDDEADQGNGSRPKLS